MAGQADDADAVNRTLDLPQQPGQHRIGPGLAAEERDLDAIGKILIDQHGDVAGRFAGPPRALAVASRPAGISVPIFTGAHILE